jgi:hypothetical protein
MTAECHLRKFSRYGRPTSTHQAEFGPNSVVQPVKMSARKPSFAAPQLSVAARGPIYAMARWGQEGGRISVE